MPSGGHRGHGEVNSLFTHWVASRYEGVSHHLKQLSRPNRPTGIHQDIHLYKIRNKILNKLDYEVMDTECIIRGTASFIWRINGIFPEEKHTNALDNTPLNGGIDVHVSYISIINDKISGKIICLRNNKKVNVTLTNFRYSKRKYLT